MAPSGQLSRDQAAGADCRPIDRLPGEGPRPLRPRIAAICRASGEDLGAILVRQGFAWAFTRFSVDCVDQQEEARAANRGHPLNAEDPVLVLIDMIHAVEPAARVVERLIMEAETALTWRSPALLAVNERA